MIYVILGERYIIYGKYHKRVQGIDIIGLRCSCCGLKLVDISKIKVSAEVR